MVGKGKYLFLNESLSVRLFSLWGVGILLNLSAWWIGHAFLPERALQGLFPAGRVLPEDGSWGHVFVFILFYNAVIAGGLIIGANLLRVGWFPLGYLPLLAHWLLFGLFLGTNSFGVSKEAKLSPSLLHLTGTTGFIEISAYTFLAAASSGLFLYRQQSWMNWKTSKERSWRELRLSGCEVLTLGVAVALIIVGAYREASSLSI